MKLIDANVFIRYFVGDHRLKQDRSRALFERIRDGQEEVFTTDIVIREVCYVLSASTHYNLTHQDIRDRLYPILSMPGLHTTSKTLCLEALNLFASGEKVDYSDALSIAYVRNGLVEGIYSYDRRLDMLTGSSRQEP